MRLVGDFASRSFYDVYWHQAGLPMERAVKGGALFFRRLELERDARVDYQLIVDGQKRTDPLNPRKLFSGTGGGEASELVMPGYTLPAEAVERRSVAKGTLRVLKQRWARPKVTIYLPPGYDARKKYSVIYTADGSAWVDLIKLPTMLNNLIADRAITPVIGVMIDATENRSAWYYFNDDYLAYLARVVAHVDRHYATEKSARGRLHVGTSAGGRITLYVGLERPALFGNIAMLSPSLSGPPHYYQSFFNGARRPDPKLRVWLGAGTYEGYIYKDTRLLERYFRRVGLRTTAAYTHEGHSFGTWRRAAVAMLRSFYSRD